MPSEMEKAVEKVEGIRSDIEKAGGWYYGAKESLKDTMRKHVDGGESNIEWVSIFQNEIVVGSTAS